MMNMKSVIMIIVLSGTVLIMTGCTTVDVGTKLKRVAGKTTFDPASYGTDALFKVIENPDSSRADAVAAAQALAARSLTTTDGSRLAACLGKHNDEKVDLAILATIKSKNMAFLARDLVKYFSTAKLPEPAAESAALIAAYMPSEESLFKFMFSMGIRNQHANVRARAAKFLSSYGSESVPVLISAMQTETSASAAMAMITGLRDFGGKPGYDVLQQVQNDVNRKFTTDSHLGTNTTAEMVRRTAVAAVEAMRRDM